MRKLIFGGLIAVGLATFAYSTEATAINSLKIQPLSYDIVLKKGEIQKGFVDISNPTDQKLEVETSVAAFRQIDDMGNIEFFEAEEIAAGVRADFDKLTLRPQQAMRMVFQVDGAKLPTGDVFAALFFTTTAKSQGDITQNIRVGTILTIENATPGAREAEITDLSTRLFNFDGQVNGSYRIKNTAEPGQVTGFRPEVTIRLWPFTKQIDQQSSLVFAGRQRENDFSLSTTRAGIYKISVQYRDSQVSSWVILLPPWSWLVAGLAVVALIVASRFGKRMLRVFRTKRR